MRLTLRNYRSDKSARVLAMYFFMRSFAGPLASATQRSQVWRILSPRSLKCVRMMSSNPGEGDFSCWKIAQWSVCSLVTAHQPCDSHIGVLIAWDALTIGHSQDRRVVSQCAYGRHSRWGMFVIASIHTISGPRSPAGCYPL